MTKARRPSRRRTPWPRLGKPIERFGFDWSEQDARQEQYRRMLRLKAHYGIEGESGWKPWYELVVAIVSEFDDGLKIVDWKAPKGRRWKGADGQVLLAEVLALKETRPDLRFDVDRLRYMKAEQAKYGDMTLDEMAVRLAEAKRHHLPPKKLRTWDGKIITRR
jgi:hypothetical protein